MEIGKGAFGTVYNVEGKAVKRVSFDNQPDGKSLL